MALDSQNKRMAAMDPMSPWRRTLPLPDGTINEGDRRQILLMARQPGETAGGGFAGDAFQWKPVITRRRRGG